MINVTSKNCECGMNQPSFNLVGVIPAICCSKCKTEDMVNTHKKSCPGQEGLCATMGNKRYKGYCTFCFQHEFPLDPLTFQIRSKTKEVAVRDFINSHFEGFCHDRIMYTPDCDCTIRRRIDHRCHINNTVLAIETDEGGHKRYNKEDEDARYNDLYMAYSGKWIYIRFNPDSYKDKNGKKRNPDISTRLRVLKTEIEKQIARAKSDENKELVEIIYMYYDEKPDKPTQQSVASLEVLCN
jgi:hypothetical protein